MDRDYTGSEVSKWFGAVKADRGNWDSLFEDIATYILPSQKNFNARVSGGSERMVSVYDGTAIYANERLSSNLHFLATNPATPWSRGKFRQVELNDNTEAVEWLEDGWGKMVAAFGDSNFDSVIGEFWLSLPAFGTAPIAVEESQPEYGVDDPDKFNGFLFQSPHLARTYGVPGPDGAMRDTFVEYELNARQAFERFGDKCSKDIKEAYEKADFTKKFAFCHAVYKRLYLETQPLELDTPPEQRMYASIHFETANGNAVEENGYYEKPRFMGRWRKRSDDDYGYGIGEKTLPDVHTLNEAKLLWFDATEKSIDPPILMGENNVIGEINQGRRGVTYVRDMAKVKYWEPPSGAFQIAEMTFADLKADIREAFFWDRLDLPPPDSGDMTAYEVGKRLERALQLFGPTLGRLYREVLNDLLQRCFNIMYRKKAFGPLPEVLKQFQGAHIDIEYDNPFARAQKAEEGNAIDMYTVDIVNTATAQVNLGMTDTVADLVDWDEIALTKARQRNIAEKLLLSDDEVTKLRTDRAKRIEAARNAELQAQQATTLKDVSQVDAGNIRAIAGGQAA